MKRFIIAITASLLVASGCDKQEAPAADEPTSEEAAKEPTKSAQKSEEADDEGAAKPAEKADEKATPTATVGEPAPDFELKDEEGKAYKLSDLKGKIVVLEWTNPDCPVVQRHYEASTMQNVMSEIGDDIVWLAVDSSNFVTPDSTKKWKQANEMDWPVLQDPEGEVGKTYGAKTTPHMYVVDAEGVLRYNGAIDDDPHGKKKAEERTNHVVEAVTALAAGKDVPKPTTKPYGCSVKYDS